MFSTISTAVFVKMARGIDLAIDKTEIKTRSSDVRTLRDQYHHHHHLHHQFMLIARLSFSLSLSLLLSLSLSLSLFLSSIAASSFRTELISVSIRDCDLWVRSYISSSAQNGSSVLLEWFVWLEVSGRTATVLWSAASMICSRHHVAFLCSPDLAFFFMHFVRVYVVHPYSGTDTAKAWEKKLQSGIFDVLFYISKIS